MQQKKEQKPLKRLKKTDREKFIEELIAETVNDFENRRKMRTIYERQWELNLNFYAGNQYCDLNLRGELTDEDDGYFWQEKQVFNHIAPIVETRLSKFSHISPIVSVRPKSDDDEYITGAKLSEKAIADLFLKNDISKTVKRVTEWSEICGTGFYKVVWSNQGGLIIGEYNNEKVFEGDVKIIPVSPFEIFPDNLSYENIEDCFSIIHARSMRVKDIKEKYGVTVMPEETDVFTLNSYEKSKIKEKVSDSALVIEKYEKPSADFPLGRLITVSNGKLLYYGELPYINGENEERTFPFIKQECMTNVGRFFGTSVVERLIPIQRSYNAVKNRKHEFINRLTMGIMMVEDGSVDIDDLESEGLPPGKVLVYRQGSNTPKMMTGLTMPNDLNEEEQKLLNEFIVISGVSDVSSSSVNAGLTSGSALEILVEQDNEKLLIPVERIRKSYIEISKQALRLYSQFLSGVRVIKSLDENGKVHLYYFDKSALNSDEVFIQGENELLYTESQKKELLFKLYESGLLSDEDGMIRPIIKEKMLNLLGYKDLDYSKGLSRLQEEKAKGENETIRKEGLNIEEIDDDKIHIEEHSRYIFSEYSELNEKEKNNLFNHLKQHKERLITHSEIKEMKGENK